jgi:hypothetical protein
MKEWHLHLRTYVLRNLDCLDQEHLNYSLDHSNLAFRYGFSNYFRQCMKYNVPFYIISGGVSAFIGSTLRSFGDIE